MIRFSFVPGEPGPYAAASYIPLFLTNNETKMATVVKHIKTGNNYILLGTGFGAFQSKKPNWLLGDLMSDTTEGQHAVACVCDEDGSMQWVDSTELAVESVDGQSIKGILS